MTAFPYRLSGAGVIMEPEPGRALVAEGVLNPGSRRGADGTVYLLTRRAAASNLSRVGLARVLVTGGVPTRGGAARGPGRHFVFYGMADSRVGVALLERTTP